MYDPVRHFSLVVPQRARQCPPLLNAILTACAKSLVKNSTSRTEDGMIEYEGIQLPGLTQNTAIEYHNACIAYFIELSNCPEYFQDENLLAAAIILRFYEVLDTAIGGVDEERFFQMFQKLVTSQANTVFSSPTDDGDLSTPGASQGVSLTGEGTSQAHSLRHAAFRMALRLEVTVAFMKQRTVHLPLELWAAQRSFEDAEDTVWTYRIILYCADVLQFCYGNELPLGKSRAERWEELKRFEDLWEFYKPPPFTPICDQKPDPGRGFCFPRILYMSDCHALGMQYLDLARILMTVYDPSIPLLGPESIAASRHTSATVQNIVKRICGTAISDRALAPSQIIAHLAIALCGHYFTNQDEQKSVIDLLIYLEATHAWPTAKTIEELKQAWS